MCERYFFGLVRFRFGLWKNLDLVKNEFGSVQFAKTQFGLDIIVICYLGLCNFWFSAHRYWCHVRDYSVQNNCAVVQISVVCSSKRNTLRWKKLWPMSVTQTCSLRLPWSVSDILKLCFSEFHHQWRCSCILLTVYFIVSLTLGRESQPLKFQLQESLNVFMRWDHRRTWKIVLSV